jgi:hypothetical protein
MKFKKKSSPRKLLSQSQPNFAEMILGWSPSKKIWFSGFRGEDLNVIFYQNMPNLHNRYISDERKISQKNPEYMLNYSLPCSIKFELILTYTKAAMVQLIFFVPPN